MSQEPAISFWGFRGFLAWERQDLRFSGSPGDVVEPQITN